MISPTTVRHSVVCAVAGVATNVGRWGIAASLQQAATVTQQISTQQPILVGN